ncbi:MAG: sigma-70 family RNA polymerase sigma factor [Oligoflexia bacterium]|nr:sigma-70 family RNA polymerase sigma factor [Oligoflexia bacterium]
MLHANSTDEELMVMYQSGSEEAFTQLYQRHSKKVYGYLRSRLLSNQEAADLMQETYLKIHKSKHLYNQSFPVLPWVFSITHSVLVDRLRKLGRIKEDLEQNLEQVSEEIDDVSLDAVELKPYLAQLPEHQQIAITNRYINEKTFEEIAEILNTSPMNVRQLVSRGLKKMKTLVRSRGKDE